MFKQKVLAGCLLGLSVAVSAEPLLAADHSLEDAFERAVLGRLGPLSRVSYEVSDCLFKNTLVNIDYCQISGQGEGDRTIRQTVDLREVEEINVTEVRGNFMMSFQLDFGGPGALWLFADLLLNGEEGSFERYSAELDAALKAAKLNSSKTFTNCGGGIDKRPNSSSFSVLTAHEPEGWRQLVDLARECRAPKGLRFTDSR